MDATSLVPLIGFAFANSITPGPNNLMLMASGANFGVRRTLAHLAGVAGGFTLMIVLVGLGVMRLFALWPPAETVLKIACAAFILWLAWRIARASAPGAAGARARPMTFLEAAVFQWLNPKAWAMALGAITLYAPGREMSALLLVAAVFGAVNLPCITTWALMGRGARRLLDRPARLAVFNAAMALLLVGTLWPVLGM